MTSGASSDSDQHSVELEVIKVTLCCLVRRMSRRRTRRGEGLHFFDASGHFLDINASLLLSEASMSMCSRDVVSGPRWLLNRIVNKPDKGRTMMLQSHIIPNVHGGGLETHFVDGPRNCIPRSSGCCPRSVSSNSLRTIEDEQLSHCIRQAPNHEIIMPCRLMHQTGPDCPKYQELTWRQGALVRILNLH